ncbi:hypothetical protein DFO70_11843 [Cytobacillus firmus]|uniref:Uncharacterized protein n=2 Tax=Cytobacillus TaxID=2675230 RepID=A0A366JLC9_CYTFI|nr:hypothetical protein DFO70_11843 [Cytobacillus firmus]TDX39447.1 hypothetical protein DFO72_11043 [Cytobacillus oceanisediminis]
MTKGLQTGAHFAGLGTGLNTEAKRIEEKLCFKNCLIFTWWVIQVEGVIYFPHDKQNKNNTPPSRNMPYT